MIEMIVKKYPSEVVRIANPVDGIYTLELKSLSRRFKYSPGQFLHLALDSDYDGIGQWPESRCFSMQSNPDEEIIRITYSVKGAFTSQMRDQLQTGDKVWLKLPYGDLFQQPHNKENVVFIAGGTGITPFLSLFTHLSFTSYHNPTIYLGFRNRAHHIYQRELEKMKKLFQSVDQEKQGIAVLTRFEDDGGRLDIDDIFSKHGSNSCYFISGPPEMISSFKTSLINKGLPDNKIFTDDWE